MNLLTMKLSLALLISGVRAITAPEFANPSCSNAPFCAASDNATHAGLVDDSCVYYISTPMNFSSAKLACEAAGAHLIKIDSWGMYDNFNDTITTQWGEAAEHWMGLFQMDKTDEPAGKFVYHNHPDPLLPEILGETPWRTGQPNDSSGTEDCVRYFTDGLDDIDCSTNSPFVCQYKSEFQQRCEALNDGLKLAAYLAPEPCGLDPCEKCLVYMRNGTHFTGSFYDAAVSCTDMPEGHLIYLPTQGHVEQLDRVMQYWPGVNFKIKVWIGLYQYNRTVEPDSGWCWDFGSGALGDEISTPWKDNEPNDYPIDGYTEQCAEYVPRVVGLNDVACDRPPKSFEKSAICQYDNGCQKVHTCPTSSKNATPATSTYSCADLGLVGFESVQAGHPTSCYMLNTEILTADDALSACKVYETANLKARLAYVPSQQVENLLEQIQMWSNAPSAFIGLKALQAEQNRTIDPNMDEFVWTNDLSTEAAQLGYKPTDVTEDDFNYTYHFCTALCHQGCERKHKWRSRHCNWPSRSFCEIYIPYM